MELTLKMHDMELSIKTDHDDKTLHEMYEYFETLLMGASFTHTQILNFYRDKSDDIDFSSLNP